MKKASLTWLKLLLFSLLPPVIPFTCPLKCNSGFILLNCNCVPCPPEQYWYMRSGVAKCEKCTSSCNEKRNSQGSDMNQVEISSCNKTSNRKCQCKPGFYCPSSVELKCRRPCLPCQNGFLSKPSLNGSCQPYTDCASLGKVVIEEGSATKDRVCGKPPTSSQMSTVDSKAVTSAILSTLTLTVPTTNQATGHQHIRIPPTRAFGNQTNITILMPVLSNPESTEIISSLPSYGNASVLFAEKQPNLLMLPTVSPLDGSVSPPETLLKTTWIFLPLLVFILLVLLCICIKRKGKTVKRKLEWAGLAFGKFQPVDAAKGQTQPQGSCPGANQQVTMDIIGKGESINNTVGSIFIYSPGTVILGSKSNERKEDAEVSSEASGELDSDEKHPMIVPQQESTSQEDFISLSMQEEFGKELCFPVPATSK